MTTIEELTEIAKEFLRKNYDITLDIPIIRNNRLRRSQGRYISTWEGVPIRIEIAGETLTYGATEYILGVLRHELIHYALEVEGEPNDDGHPHFEAELLKHRALSTGTNRVGLYVEYDCDKCGKTILTWRKRILTHPHCYATVCCTAKLINVRERIYNGTEAIK